MEAKRVGSSVGWLVILALIGISTLWARWLQPRVSLTGGAAWDGSVYYSMAEQSAAGSWALEGNEPYAHRAAVPLLVGRIQRLIGSDVSLVDIFDAINTIAAISAAILLFVWLGSFTDSFAHRCVGVILFLASWAGPLRYNAWLPTLVDSFWWVVWCAGLLALERAQQRKPFATTVLCVVLGLGMLVRESTIWLCFGTLAFLTNWRGVRIVVAGGLVALVAAYVSIAVFDGNSLAGFVEQTTSLSKFRVEERTPLLMLLAASVAFGPILILLATDPRGVARGLASHPYQVPIILVLSLGTSLGLSSQVRHVYWAAPLVYSSLMVVLDRWKLGAQRRYLFIVALVALQSIAARVWWPIPDEPALGATPELVWLTPLGGTGHWENLDVWWAPDVMRHIVALQYLMTFAALGILLLAGSLWRWREKASVRIRQPTSP